MCHISFVSVRHVTAPAKSATTKLYSVINETSYNMLLSELILLPLDRARLVVSPGPVFMRS